MEVISEFEMTVTVKMLYGQVYVVENLIVVTFIVPLKLEKRKDFIENEFYLSDADKMRTY